MELDGAQLQKLREGLDLIIQRVLTLTLEVTQSLDLGGWAVYLLNKLNRQVTNY